MSGNEGNIAETHDLRVRFGRKEVLRSVSLGFERGTVTAMLATSLLVIQFLANPYHPGYGSLQPTAMVRVLDQIQQATTALHLPVRIPCDSGGHPRV